LDTGYQFVPPVSEVPRYDADGNVLSDGRFTYAWDGENRLKEIAWKAPGNIDAKINYTYDGYSRRVLKQEWRKINSLWKIVDYVGFIYDGWNHVMTVRINENNTPRGRVASYAWGPDIASGCSGYSSWQSAGGVGGLLCVLDTSNSQYCQFPLMDRMGNITGYRRAVTGIAAVLDAVFEYDAFGRELKSAGVAADAMQFRFSTKYTDGESGLVYYGYRFMDPEKGRWVNRDPIAERGGLNLFGMVGNDGVNYSDVLGACAQNRRKSLSTIREGRSRERMGMLN
jgi:RHS repeat-associated protein